MKLKALQNLTIIDTLTPLKEMKSLHSTKLLIQVAPSNIDLILLGTNLLYKSYLLSNGMLQKHNNITALQCTNEAIKIVEILRDYENKYIDFKEFKKIKKKFNLK